MRYLKKKKETDRKCEKPQDSRTKEKDNEERRQNHGPKKHVWSPWDCSRDEGKDAAWPWCECVYFHHPKEAKRGLTHWPQTEKEATPNIATQEGSPGVCTNPAEQLNSYSWTVVPKPFLVMSPGFFCMGVMEECMSGGWQGRNLWKIASNQQWNM